MGKPILTVSYLTNTNCNFNCEYCFDKRDKTKLPGSRLHPDLVQFVLDKNKSYDLRSMWFAGGEPFIVPGLTEAISTLTRNGVYCIIGSNLTYGKFEDFIKQVDMSFIRISASLHYKELERTKLVDRWINNWHLLKNSGIRGIAAHSINYPGTTPKELEAFKSLYLSKGVEHEVFPFIGNYGGVSYPIKKDVVKGNPKCRAGNSHMYIDGNGDIYPCVDYFFCKKDKMGNISEKDFKLNSSTMRCTLGHCGCPPPKLW